MNTKVEVVIGAFDNILAEIMEELADSGSRDVHRHTEQDKNFASGCRAHIIHDLRPVRLDRNSNGIKIQCH